MEFGQTCRIVRVSGLGPSRLGTVAGRRHKTRLCYILEVGAGAGLPRTLSGRGASAKMWGLFALGRIRLATKEADQGSLPTTGAAAGEST